MPLKLDDDQARESLYDDNQPGWYKPSREIADLEEAYDSPSATDEDLPDGHPDRSAKQSTPEELRDQEESAPSSPWSTKVGSDAEETEKQTGNRLQQLMSRLRKDKHESNTSRLAKRRAALAVGGGTGLLILGLVVLIFMFAASLKAVHFGKVLRTAGFAGSQLVMRTAFSDAAYSHWATANDTAELPRSSLLEKLRGQDMRKIQQDLAARNEFKYTVDAAGQTTGFEVQGERVNFDDLARKLGAESFEDLSFREKLAARKYLTDRVKFGIGETFDVETRSFRNGFWKGFRAATGIKMTRFRTVARDRFGNRTVNDTLNNDTARLTDEYADIRGEPVTSDIPQVDEAADATAETLEENSRRGVRLRAQEAFDAYLQTKGSDIGRFQDGMSKASTAIFATTLYCLGHDLSKTSERLTRQQELSMARYGHQQQTTIDQIMEGDVTSEDVAFVSREWAGDDQTPDATQAALYKQNTGSPISGTADLDRVPRTNLTLPPLDWLKSIDGVVRTILSLGTNQIPELDDALGIDDKVDSAISSGCGVVMDPYVQSGILLVDLGVSLATLGSKDLLLQSLKGAAMFAGFTGLGQIIESYVQQVAGTGITGMEVGADKYNAAAVSTDYLNSQTSRGVAFARPQTTAEAATAKQIAMDNLRQHYNSGSFTERYFAITNPNSLLGLTVARMPNSLTDGAQRTSSFLSNLASGLSRPFGLFGQMLSWPAQAAALQDVAASNDFFGVNQWGWTQAELNVMAETNLFDNAAEVEAAIEADPAYYEDLEGCYASNRLLQEVAKDGKCTAGALSDARALKWRIYRLHSFAVDQISSEGINEN